MNKTWTHIARSGQKQIVSEIVENTPENTFKKYENYKDKYERTKNYTNIIIISNMKKEKRIWYMQFAWGK